MILAEKIIKMRKQQGWSQEDLAMHMGVSRQSVSKWESMTSIPDLDKIVKLSKLFGVSTDYLLRDELEEDPACNVTSDEKNSSYDKRKVTLDEANKYMELRTTAATRIAAGVAACIVSPVLLIVMTGFAELGMINMTEDMAGGFGAAVLLVIIASAVMNFIAIGIKLDKFEYMEQELLDLEYGVAGITAKKKEEYEDIHKLSIALGIGLCITSVVPLLISEAFIEKEHLAVVSIGILLVMIAIGVFLIVKSSTMMGTYEHLLEEGDYTPEKKVEAKKNKNLSTVYWCCALAIYLLWSFLTMDWHMTWVVWPVAGVLYGAVCALANMVRDKKVLKD